MIGKILGRNGKICFVLSPTQVHRIEEKELLTNRRVACFLLMVLLVGRLAKAVVRCKRRLEVCCTEKTKFAFEAPVAYLSAAYLCGARCGSACAAHSCS